MGRSIILSRHIDIHITHACPGRLVLQGLVHAGIGSAGPAAFCNGYENHDRVFRKSRGVLTGALIYSRQFKGDELNV